MGGGGGAVNHLERKGTLVVYLLLTSSERCISFNRCKNIVFINKSLNQEDDSVSSLICKVLLHTAMTEFPSTLSYIAWSRLPSRAYIFRRLNTYASSLLSDSLAGTGDILKPNKGTRPFRVECEVIASFPPRFRTSLSLTDLMVNSRSGTVLTQTQVACFYLYGARQGD